MSDEHRMVLVKLDRERFNQLASIAIERGKTVDDLLQPHIDATLRKYQALQPVVKKGKVSRGTGGKLVT